MDLKFVEARPRIEALLGYTFNHPNILKEAFWSYPAQIDGKSIEGNRALAVVGDSVLDVMMNKECYQVGMSASHIDARRLQKLCNIDIDRLGRGLGLERFLNSNPGAEFVSNKMVETLVEAIFGALFLDSNMDFELVRQGMIAFGFFDD